jgi:hypothetical protein
MDRFRWTGLYAYSTANGQQLNNCLYLRAKESNATNVRQYFGDCGVAPTFFAGVPTNVCQEGAGVWWLSVVVAQLLLKSHNRPALAVKSRSLHEL